MPTDRVSLDAEPLAARVEYLIGGRVSHGPISADLREAVEIYQVAGRTALHHHQDRTWFHALVTPRDWATAEYSFATDIAKRLDQLTPEQPGWWFLRKHPCWRVRIRTSDHAAATTQLDELVICGDIANWQPGIYEPETAAFGGPTGMDIIHDLFCADSRGALAFFGREPHALGRRALSLLLIRALQQHAGLDWFEAGDVFARVAQMRPAVADTDRIDALAATMKPLLSLSLTSGPAFTDPATAAHAEPWIAAFSHAGRQLRDAATTNRLDRGLRAVIAQTMIFHWNRLGLSATTQSILAQAAQAAILPRS
jgi:thiopeptide-type bacteriocin biosynthesis protein